MASEITEARKRAIDETFGHVEPFGLFGSSMYLATKMAKAMLDLEGNQDMSPQQQREIMNQVFGTQMEIPTRQLDPRPNVSPLGAAYVIDKPLPAPRIKRKVSAYSKQFGKELKRLKIEHPRTPVTKLMKRAHTATKKIMKKVAPKGRLSKGRRTIARSGQFRRDKILPRRK